MKNRILAGGVAALLGASALSVAFAAPASATYDDVCTPSDAWTEYIDHPAEGEPTITVDNPDYIPAVEEVSHVVHHPAETVEHEAVTHVEYKWGKQNWNGPNYPNKGKWHTIPGQTTDWTTDVKSTEPWVEGQYHSSSWFRWIKLDERTVTDKEAWTEVIKEAWDETIIDVPGKPAVGEPTITIDNPDYVEAWTEEVQHDAVTCPTGPGHNANGEATCGAWDITLYNQQEDGYIARTASFVVYIDGTFSDAYAVQGGEQQAISGTFAEDSGNHQVIVRSGPAQGDEFIFSLDVTSDCIAPQPDDEVVVSQATPTIPCDAVVGDEIETTSTVTTTPYVLVEGEWVAGEPVVTTEDSVYVVTEADVDGLECPVVTPPTEKPKPTVVTKAAAKSDSTLAQTGGELSPWLLAGGIATLLAGAGSILVARRKH